MRHYDWPEKLFDIIGAAKRSTFKWGSNDCALFACDCAKAMTGVDHAANFRGKYKTERGALTSLKKIEGVETLSQLADKYLGAKIGLSHARRGDVVLISVGSRDVLGVVAGNCAVFLTLGGIRTVSLRECTCAWRVE